VSQISRNAIGVGEIAAASPRPAAVASRTFKMTVAYDGTCYAGWQVQLRRQTIQGMLEKAIAQVTNERTRVTGSGRTDSGVHAIGQVASFSLGRWRAGADDLARAINSKLPPDIAVSEIVDAPEDFHAIRDALGKRYRYQLQVGGPRDAFEYRFRWHLAGPIDIAAMRQAAEQIRGRNDFASFQAAGSERKTTVRDVRALEIIEQPTDGRAGQGGAEGSSRHIAIEVEADGFLYNMVRNIVGTLVEVGRCKRQPDWIADVLAARDRTIAGPTAPPHGLCLLHVDYAPFNLASDTPAEER
jgi:tRNA pseudouridine38-40 synthase